MLALTVAALLLLGLTVAVVWRVTGRIWQAIPVLALALLLYPAIAAHLRGDVSRYFPAGTFATGIEGKDQIVLASAIATLVVALMAGGTLCALMTVAWRRWRKGCPSYHIDNIIILANLFS